MESVLGLVRHPGNDALFRAVEMSLVSTLAGRPLHIHAEGLRGTGKTTIMRRVRKALPRIRRIRGCLYNCDPSAPHCPVHRGLSPEEVAALGEERVPMPFLEISHAAKIGTVVGSIDLSRLVSATHPEAALLPGTIPQAHRGILFVDEINRLAETSPELADVLLDVMGTRPGRVQIEETGLPPVELPVLVSVWAASNPDEEPGPLEEIRRQLSDRFDFAIYTDRPSDPEVVEQILTAAEAGEARPPRIADTKAELWRTRLTLRTADLRQVTIPPGIRRQVAALYSQFDLESLRGVEAIQAGIRLSACLDGRREVQPEDLLRVVPMALRHRVDPELLRRVTSYLAEGLAPAATPAPLAAASGGPATAPGRTRFPGLSFGGVLAEPARPLPAGAEPGTGRPSPGAAAGTGPGPDGRAEGVTGAAPAHAAASAAGTGPAADPGPAGGTPTGPDAGTRSGDLKAAGSRGPVDPGTGAARVASGAGAQPGEGTHGRAGGSWLHRALARLRVRPSLPDPATLPPQAPPNPARPLSALAPEDWVRTEEELGHP
ncbi:hypothetical protein [Symbiobacterium thermophilum]|uniref:hypothetical protein n=1 Tax=Symbiobacterium thermophilum TaxID=2734 RepID=UPI00235348BA|nr:hypothetical protein [Symbiobacterium thermophilum]